MTLARTIAAQGLVGIGIVLATACSDETRLNARKDDDHGKSGAGETPGDQAEGGTPDSGADAAPAAPASPSPPAGDEAASDGDGADGGGDAIAQLLADCGGADVTAADPDAVVYEKTLEALPIVKNVTVATVTLKSTLGLKVTGKTQEQDALTEVVSVDGILASLVRPTAEAEAAKVSGKSTLTMVPFAEYPGLADHAAWKGILCTFVPVSRVENLRGGKKTVATFAPAMPSSVSPKAVAARYEAEIGESHVFEGIVATIVESDHPDLAGKGPTITGKVTVTKVSPTTSVSDGAGGRREIKADLAYKAVYDFGGPKATFALGFAPEVTFYISHEKKDLVANVVDTSAAGGAVAVFIHD